VTPGTAHFVDDLGRFMASYGMPPIAGRMWAWLLICEPPEQSAGEIAEALGASRGSISGAARVLETAGFIRRSTRRGDRREYFSAPSEGFRSLLASAGAAYRRIREIAERGLEAIADRPPESRERLEEFREVMAFVEVELPAAIGRFLEEREGDQGRLAV
jgi:DNA-binding transcriptional regulator GbsR (MarR family)